MNERGVLSDQQPNAHVSVTAFQSRLQQSTEESDTALIYDLLILGELTSKLITAAAVAAVDDDLDRTRYGFEYRLLRADGIGEWERVLSELLTGPANALLRPETRPHIFELTENSRLGEMGTSWQRDCLESLEKAYQAIDAAGPKLSDKVSLRWWFSSFAQLRNRTRGHGALTAEKASLAAQPLAHSIELLASNAGFLRIPWLHLHQNLNSRYRITTLAGDPYQYAYLKSESHHRLESGVVHLGFGKALIPSPLVEGRAGLSELAVANGVMRHDGRAEFLNYVTDERTQQNRSRWLALPERLPESETRALPTLNVLGRTYSNLPERLANYVPRTEIETSLRKLLADDRHPVITLVGLGGVGKTSLAVEVLHQVAHETKFFAILWFSARDIDLLPTGPKAVRPDVLTKEDVAKAYLSMMTEERSDRISGAQSLEAWTDAMTNGYGGDPVLFVFDNFETVANPEDLYQYIDQYVRLPNKVLITTRMRTFKADYPLEVHGMSKSEFEILAANTAQALNVSALLTAQYLESLFEETGGHPYLTKIVLGEVAKSQSASKVERMIGKQEDVLHTLFERTFGSLSAGAQRVFLTLCSWRSLVPAIALEAAIMRPSNERFDVTAALDELHRSSLIELQSGEGGVEFASVPLSAYLFGQGKLRVSPLKPAIEMDSRLLQQLGPMRASDVSRGLGPHGRRMLARIQDLIATGGDVADQMAVIEYMANSFPELRLDVASMYLDGATPNVERAIDEVNSFIIKYPDETRGWLRLAEIGKRYSREDLELHARMQLAELSGADLEAVSEAASAYARLRHSVTDKDVRRAMEERLIMIFSPFEPQADGMDLSRLAWLFVYSGQYESAAVVVRSGLDKEPSNMQLLKLSQLKDIADLV